MRIVLAPGMHLSRLPAGMKVLLTCFLVLVALGLWVAELKYSLRADFGVAGAARYLSGDPGAGTDPFAGVGVVEDPREVPPAEPKSYAWLVDVAHPHAFTVPILYFVLFHLLSLTRLREWQRVTLHLWGFASVLGTFASPFWIVRERAAAWLLPVAGTSLFASFALVIGVLLWETWCVRPPRRVGAR